MKEVVEQKEELITKIKKLQVNGSHLEFCHSNPDELVKQEHAKKKEGSQKSSRNREELHLSLPQLPKVVWLGRINASAHETEAQEVLHQVLHPAQNKDEPRRT